MRKVLLMLLCGALAACGDDTVRDSADARGRADARPVVDADPSAPDARADAAPGSPDAAVDAPPASNTHLLLSEVKTVDASEFIEIYNPGAAAVDLTNYYLADTSAYFRVPENAANPINVDNSDFISRFPAGASIPAGGTVVVVTDAAQFETAFPGAVAAYFTLEEDNAQSTEMIVVGEGAAPSRTLTNSGELVALFFWDGDSDLVQDVDLVLAGNMLSANNNITAKAAVDGPDGGTDTTAYLTDALTLPQFGAALATGNSYKRIADEGANETDTGGNGILGHDETSENTAVTWDDGSTAATPGAAADTL